MPALKSGVKNRNTVSKSYHTVGFLSPPPLVWLVF